MTDQLDAVRRAEGFNLPLTLAELKPPRAEAGLLDSPELAALWNEGQLERQDVDRSPADLAERDLARRVRVMKAVRGGGIHTPADYFHAAGVLQHGSLPEHYHLAFDLARRAADAGHPPARWLAAAAMDRWLMSCGLPQRFGTQYVDRGDGWMIYEVDPVTTDEERAGWDVPPLAELQARVDELNSPAAPADQDAD